MPELLTAWVTVAVSGRDLKRDIGRAFNEAERNAKITPKIDSSRLSNDATSAGRRYGSRFSAAAKLDPKVNTSGLTEQGGRAGKDFGDRFASGAKTALATLGLAGGVAALASQFKQVMSIGMDWTNNMNTLTAVTGASAEQLKAAGAAARALGNDITLPATSANDAASAMTELAKGGFTVQQSMDAAKGSLQLAAAAGITATQAATIQSQALQAFGLRAGDAGKMSDTLANAANASSAEITDVAQALQQAGTVANQFGLSAEDTAAAIALLANNGIQGSDAGTLLKSSLLALTDQGKPAREAIRELGLNVYDAQGRFVGLHELFGQLGEASKTMTNEQYQAATATLFGSDAMRLAGVAAKDGSASYDLVRTAIDRQGAAADVAAAKTKGLPGAWERVKNGIEALQLKAYDAAEGPLSTLLDKMSGGLDKFGDSWDTLANNPQIASLLADSRSAISGLVEGLRDAGPAITPIVKSLAAAGATLGGAAWKAFVTTLETATDVIRVLTPALKFTGELMSEHQGLVTTAAAAWLAFRLVPGIMGRVTPALATVNNSIANVGKTVVTAGAGVRNFTDAYRTSVQWMRQANPTVSTAGRVLFGVGSDARTASAHLRVLGTNAGSVVSGGFNALKGAAGGLVGALGGPFSAALIVAGAAFTTIAAKNDAATTSLNSYNEALKASRTAQNELNDALIASGGQLDEQAMEKLKGSLGSLNEELTAAGGRQGSFADQFRDQSGSLWGGFKSQIFTLGENPEGNLDTKIRMQADTAKSAKDAIDALNLSQEQLAQQVGGGQPVFDALVANLEKQGAGGLIASEKLKQLRIDLLGAQKAGATVNPVLRQLGEDVVGTASQIKTAFDAVPKDVPVSVSAPGGQAVFDLLTQLGQQVSQDNDKTIQVDAPLAPAVLETLRALGYEVQNNNGKLIVVDADTTQADTKMRQFIDTWSQAIVRPTVAVPGQSTGAPTNPLDVIAGRSAGAIVAMASGGLRQIRKPTAADIYAGRGAGTIFAEEETGGEAYIPLAAGKRRRSTAILAEVARRFGLNVMADGGITASLLKQFASGIAGRVYNWGAGDGDTFDTDCSGAQSTVANYITGATGRFSTDGQAAALLARGFQAGDPPQGIQAYWIGWRNGGPGGGHTAGTILDPDGGNVNVEMGGKSGGGQYGGTAAGAGDFPNRAWIALASGDDPNQSSGGSSAAVKSAQASVTSSRASVTSAQNSVDKAQANLDKLRAEGASAEKISEAEKRKEAADQRLTAAQERQEAAETRLAEVKDKAASQAESGDGGGKDFGKGLMSGLFGGLMESIGLPGFANLLDSPNFQSGKALLNAFAGPLTGALSGKLGIQQSGWVPGMPIDTGDGSTTTVGPPGGGGGLPGIGIPGAGDFLKPLPEAGRQVAPGGNVHQGTGAAPGGDTTNVSYQMTGVDPKVGLRKADAHANQAYRSSGLRAVRPV